MKYSEMDGIKKIAYKNVKGVFNYEVGGWLNCTYDGYEEDIPDTIEEAKEIIYDEAMSCSAGDGWFSLRPVKEVHFAGEKFVRDMIDKLFAKDGDVAEIASVKGWTV